MEEIALRIVWCPYNGNRNLFLITASVLEQGSGNGFQGWGQIKLRICAEINLF